MLYDQVRNSQVEIPCDGLTAEELEAFCSAAKIQFISVGTNENRNDQTMFSAGTIEFPMRGVTIAFSKVIEWKHALAAIGEQVAEGGMYRSYDGDVVTTVCDALDSDTNERLIVYRGQDGRTWTRAYADFFRVVENVKGELVPRYVHFADGA